jgi:transcriptional regulator with XRE-family HTH domain
VDRGSVGARIKALRKSRGLRGKDLADRTGLSAAAISKFENGLLRPTDNFIEAVIQALNLSAAETYALRELSTFVNSQFARWSLNQKQVKTNQINIGIREKNSKTIRGYFNQIIPGLLQSESYMRAVFQSLIRPEKDNLNQLVKSRLKRQNILNSKRTSLTFVLGEGALRTCFSSRSVLKDQLKRLMEIIDMCPSTEIRVLPWQKVLNSFVLDSFVIYDERTVNIEVLKGELDLWTDEDVAFYVDTMNYLVSASLSPAASRDFIKRITQDLDKDGEL